MPTTTPFKSHQTIATIPVIEIESLGFAVGRILFIEDDLRRLASLAIKCPEKSRCDPPPRRPFLRHFSQPLFVRPLAHPEPLLHANLKRKIAGRKDVGVAGAEEQVDFRGPGADPFSGEAGRASSAGTWCSARRSRVCRGFGGGGEIAIFGPTGRRREASLRGGEELFGVNGSTRFDEPPDRRGRRTGDLLRRDDLR